MERWWNLPQRVALLTWMIILTMFQLFVISELFADLSTDVVEVMSFGYEFIGFVIAFLILSAAGSFTHSYIKSACRQRVVEYVNVAFGGIAAMLIATLTYQMRINATLENPEYVTALTLFGGVLSLFFLLGSIPDRVYTDQYNKAVDSVKGVLG